ncbi:hypothetical protein V6L77_00035 [Pannonibacter sp. Pt2-lr]
MTNRPPAEEQLKQAAGVSVARAQAMLERTPVSNDISEILRRCPAQT